MDQIDPRRLAGVLADPELRAAYARVVLGSDLDDALAHLSPARRKKARASLVGSGLVAVDADGTASAPDSVFRAILAQQPATPPAQGVERFLRDGRITQWPAGPADLDDLLRHVVAEALDPDEVLDEKTLTARLLRVTDDHALLRRHLVDAGLLLRTRSGSEYARAEAHADPRDGARATGEPT
ncbi:DUF2087 domain-containing protein [Clavibacter sepedonicus]|uniref:DUF2087 domain-containing protein n=1 Tax=Clavibacter TaxID=1573 RepID=UPI0002EFAEA9|nr:MULTISPECIES: DUF2087 domain-containing protein [Clavibacter]MBD5382931.1 DUF2087 domain-containing protein [Clavibacter sp.]UUK66023.1 DUF2087 domain-containing protein [Clavibacter sepedonicus]